MTGVQSENEPSPLDRRGTLHPYVNAYVKGRVDRREIVNASARAAKMILGGFAESFGNRQLKFLGRADVLRYQESIAHLSIGTRRNRLSITKAFVSWLQIEGRIKLDPFVGIKFPKPPRRVPRALTRDECDRLWAVLPDSRARAIVALALGMGLRRIEIRRCQQSDWDRHKGTLRVLGKGGHERLLPVPDHVAGHLAGYVGNVHGPLIRVDAGGPISDAWIGRLMRQWMEDAGIKVAAGDGKGCHSLRHTIASEIADIEPDIRVVQEMLGHASLANTQIYLRGASLGKMREAMNDVAGTDCSPVPPGPTEVATDLAGQLVRALTAVRTSYAVSLSATWHPGREQCLSEVAYIERCVSLVLGSATASAILAALTSGESLTSIPVSVAS